MTAEADAQLAISGGDDNGQRVRDPQQLAPQALLTSLHHRAVLTAAVDLRLKLLHAEVVCQCLSDFIRRNSGAVDTLKVQRRPARASASAISHLVPSAHTTPS